MPALLLTAWPYIKRFSPWLLGALLIVGSYWYAHHAGAEAQRAKDASTIAAYKAALAQSTANVAVMKKAIDQQNADAQARAAAFNASKAADAKNVAAANAAWEKSQAARKTLADIAAHRLSGCKADADLLNALGDM